MRFPVYAEHSNPRSDPPKFRVNTTTARGWIQYGYARALGQDLKSGIQLTGKKRHDEVLTASELVAALSDWRTVQLSHLPDQEVLLITTRQLKTA